MIEEDFWNFVDVSFYVFELSQLSISWIELLGKTGV